MIKRHAFSFIGWLITFIFAYMWRCNVELLKDGIQFSTVENQHCDGAKTLENEKLSIKPKKIMILMQYLNDCDTINAAADDHCDDLRMMKKAYLRNYYHTLDREWDEVDITFKFFIGEKEYRTWMKTGRDRIFRDSRVLYFDYQFNASWKTMPFGLLLSFGITSNLFYEKVFDFDIVFALDDQNGIISKESMEKTILSLSSYDAVVLRTKQTEQYQLALGYKALWQVAHHSYLHYPEHPMERNYSVINGFNMMHRIVPDDIKNFQNYFDKLMADNTLSFLREDILEHGDINPIEKYYEMSNDEFFENTGFKEHTVSESSVRKSADIGFTMTPSNSCHFNRTDPKSEHLMTTFVLQTRLEILQRKLFRKRISEHEQYYSPDENAMLDNFYLQIMGRANKLELFEITRQLLQDDFNYNDIVVADFIEEHERIKYDRQEVSYLHQSAIEYAYRCRNYETRPTDYIILLRAGRVLKLRELLDSIIKQGGVGELTDKKELDPEVATIVCLEGPVLNNERPNLFVNDRYILPDQFPLNHHYPSHCQGSYLLTRAAVELLHENMGRVDRNKLRMEDVYITGMIREISGLTDIRSIEGINGLTVLKRYQELIPFF